MCFTTRLRRAWQNSVAAASRRTMSSALVCSGDPRVARAHSACGPPVLAGTGCLWWGRYLLLSSLMFNQFFAAHMLACIWGGISASRCEQYMLDGIPEPTWIYAKGIQCATPQEKYTVALYWAFATMTTVGSADRHSHPQPFCCMRHAGQRWQHPTPTPTPPAAPCPARVPRWCLVVHPCHHSPHDDG